MGASKRTAIAPPRHRAATAAHAAVAHTTRTAYPTGGASGSRYGARDAGTADGRCENSYAAAVAPAFTAAAAIYAWTREGSEGAVPGAEESTKNTGSGVTAGDSERGRCAVACPLDGNRQSGQSQDPLAMRVFISDVDSYLGRALRKQLSREDEVEVVGTVASLEQVPVGIGRVVEVRRAARGPPALQRRSAATV